MDKGISIEDIALSKEETGNKLKYELRILKRLMYKSKNQHRRAAFFHKLEDVKRTVTRLVQLPSEKGSTEVTMQNNIDFYKLAEKAASIILDAYLSCRQDVVQTYFMALCMTFMAVLAQLTSLIKSLMIHQETEYDTLHASLLNPKVELKYPFPLRSFSKDYIITLPVIATPSRRRKKSNSVSVKPLEVELAVDISGASSEIVLHTEAGAIEDTFWKTPVVPVTKRKRKKSTAKSAVSDDIDDIFSNF